MMLDYRQHIYDDHGIAGGRGAWNSESMHQPSGSYNNHVLPSSPFWPSSEGQIPYSQTTLGYGQGAFSRAPLDPWSMAPSQFSTATQLGSTSSDHLVQALHLDMQNISIQHKSDKKCRWDGCGKVFQKQSALMAHEKNHSEPERECEFCKRRVSGAHKNLRSHIRRHIEGVRLDYYEGAQDAYDKMTQRGK